MKYSAHSGRCLAVVFERVSVVSCCPCLHFVLRVRLSCAVFPCGFAWTCVALREARCASLLSANSLYFRPHSFSFTVGCVPFCARFVFWRFMWFIMHSFLSHS